MNRRRIFGAALAALVFAGITAGPGTADAQSPTVDRNAAVTYVSSTGPGGWDPARGRNQFQDTIYLTMVYDRLVLLAKDGSIDPLVATKWTTSPDGKTITFTLRQGMRFHDGTPLNSAAVVRSIRRSKTLPGSSVAFQLENVTAVDAPNPSTVVVRLAAPEPAILYVLASTAGMIISPKALDSNQDLLRKPAGSGPYKMKTVTALGAVYERNDAYFDRSANPAKVRRLKGIVDLDARLNSVKSGESDVGQFSANEWPTINAMVKSGRFKVAQYPSTNVVPMWLNTKIKPLDNPKVRLALNLAINRELINERLMYGKCPPASQTFQPGVVGHVPSYQYKYDPERAKRLLREAGVGDGFTIKFLATGTEPVRTFGIVIRDMLAEIGVKFSVTTLEPAAIRATFRTGQYGAAIQALSSLSPDPSSYVNSLYLGPDNPGGAPQFFAQRAKRAQTLPLGSVARRKAYEQLNKMMFDEPTHVYVCQSPQLYVHRNKVIGTDRFAYSSLSPIADVRYLGVAK